MLEHHIFLEINRVFTEICCVQFIYIYDYYKGWFRMIQDESHDFKIVIIKNKRHIMPCNKWERRKDIQISGYKQQTILVDHLWSPFTKKDKDSISSWRLMLSFIFHNVNKLSSIVNFIESTILINWRFGIFMGGTINSKKLNVFVCHIDLLSLYDDIQLSGPNDSVCENNELSLN